MNCLDFGDDKKRTFNLTSFFVCNETGSTAVKFAAYTINAFHPLDSEKKNSKIAQNTHTRTHTC